MSVNFMKGNLNKNFMIIVIPIFICKLQFVVIQYTTKTKNCPFLPSGELDCDNKNNNNNNIKIKIKNMKQRD